jgi:hypothetical protein
VAQVLALLVPVLLVPVLLVQLPTPLLCQLLAVAWRPLLAVHSTHIQRPCLPLLVAPVYLAAQ